MAFLYTSCWRSAYGLAIKCSHVIWQDWRSEKKMIWFDFFRMLFIRMKDYLFLACSFRWNLVYMLIPMLIYYERKTLFVHWKVRTKVLQNRAHAVPVRVWKRGELCGYLVLKILQNFSRFPVTSNLWTYVWSIKYK